jgi:Holliday junction DNA helicase RuvA
MIGRISGILAHKQPPDILVDVGGVGYELQVPMTTLYQLPELGAEVRLFTHFVVRDDAQLLYGFYDEADRGLFRKLIRVNGVGPKLALTILSGMDADQFARCVGSDDVASLVRLPGVGRKTAERLVVEMRDQLKEWIARLDGQAAPGPVADAGGAVDFVADAEGALIALGYKPQEAARAVAAANDEGVTSSEELIRRALKSMVTA